MTDLRTETARLLALKEGTTPGPWMAESGHEQSNGQLYWQVTDGSDAIMQNQFCWCQGDHAANARLIAAAPDLLDAIAALQAENAALRAQVDEAVAGAYAAAADSISAHLHAHQAPTVVMLSAVLQVQALTPADAQAALARRDVETREKLARLVAVSKRYSDENDRYDEDNRESMKSWRDARLALIAALAEIEGSHA